MAEHVTDLAGSCNLASIWHDMVKVDASLLEGDCAQHVSHGEAHQRRLVTYWRHQCVQMQRFQVLLYTVEETLQQCSPW